MPITPKLTRRRPCGPAHPPPAARRGALPAPPGQVSARVLIVTCAVQRTVPRAENQARRVLSGIRVYARTPRDSRPPCTLLPCVDALHHTAPDARRGPGGETDGLWGTTRFTIPTTPKSPPARPQILDN
ncbi:hypothetical protein HYPSUDRAFT_38195 [Hypholoma sublateritium FD-334 SS-4]|uniref:Uncharacterized protein n=1 Tax=Hypholoma sublateritium (strain FD-334 SS-4) TaxID=945553 RepID=A0A0D2MLU1_HYPSF|nr:hypothetical protein HYPSUDRAFT_38195 [Hypholoma sublateritium FD-334 SS-4]